MFLAHAPRRCLAALCAALLCAAPQSHAVDARSFSHPVSGLDQAQRLDFALGRSLFERLWVSSPASTQAADGLGPLYNARSCSACHPGNGRGNPRLPGQSASQPLVLKIDVPANTPGISPQLLQQWQRQQIGNIPEPTYGIQLQNFATPGISAEYQLSIDHVPRRVTLDDGAEVTLQQPRYNISQLGYGALHADTRLSPRLAPPLIGLGLLEAIDAAQILQNADPDDTDQDGISGRANRVWSRRHQAMQLGRFGHKAGLPTLEQQIQSAFNIDLGLSVPLYTDAAGDCTLQQHACRQARNGNSPQYANLEAHQQVTGLVEHFVRNLAVPPQRNARTPDVMAGKVLFKRSGCASCHTPSYRVTSTERGTHMIYPYTDLLLHDMGEGLADHRPEGLANGREWRTPPLWGIGLTRAVSGGEAYLHDGRARSLLEAILWHGGEAQAARDAVAALPTEQRRQLLAFLESL